MTTQISKMGIDIHRLRASVCRESFFEFVKYFWDTIIPEKPHYNWHIEYLCDELQTVAERVFKGQPREYDLIINISPGTTKSTICSRMFPAWAWTRMQTARCICASYAYTLAMDLSRSTRDIINSELFKNTFPGIELRGDQNTKHYFLNTEGGARYSVGTGGTITGMHGHFLIIDDPLNPLEAVSEVELKACNRWMRETLPTRKVHKAITPIILIMQRLHQNDPTGMMLETFEGKIRHICLPAESTDHIQPPELKNKYKNGLFDPIRMDEKVLFENRAALGEYGYAGQFLQHPVPLGGGMFKIENIEVGTPPGTISSKVRYWDKAGSQDTGAYTVGVLMGRAADGRFWVLDVIRGQWDSSRREKIIRATAEMDGKGVTVGIEQEPGSGGKESAENTVRNLAGWKIKVDRPTGDKATRADPYSCQVNAGNVSLATGEWNRAYMDELQYFPHSTYKDQTDASAGAFNLLAKPKVRLGAF